MSTKFTVTAKGKKAKFQDNVSLGDAVRYEIDFSPWQEDNSAITSVTWNTEYGAAAISGQALSNGVASALLTFNEDGRSLVSILATTATEKKKVWLEIFAKDYEVYPDIYGDYT